jgi:hypothetical protein
VQRGGGRAAAMGQLCFAYAEVGDVGEIRDRNLCMGVGTSLSGEGDLHCVYGVLEQALAEGTSRVI